MDPLSGSFAAEYFRNGNPLALSYGSMASVCSSQSIPGSVLMMDALDECPNSHGIPSSRAQVLSLVKQLMDLRLPYLHICVTSRPEFDIRATLGRLALHSVSLHDESGQKEDIVDYVKSVVYSDSDETMMRRWREEDKKMVVETLSE